MGHSLGEAQLICLRLPFCYPGFESQAHYLCFYQFIFELCQVEKTKINKRGDRHSSVASSAAVGLDPNHTMYAVFNLYYWKCNEKRTKQEDWIGQFILKRGRNWPIYQVEISSEFVLLCKRIALAFEVPSVSLQILHHQIFSETGFSSWMFGLNLSVRTC